MNQHLDALILAEADFPSSLKLQLLLRSVAAVDLANGADPDRLTAFLRIISPWPPGAVGEKPVFDPKKPLLCAIEASPKEAMETFNDEVCKHMLHPWISRGEDGAQHLKLLTSSTLGFLEEVLEFEVDDDFGEGVGKIMGLLRGILYLLHPVPGFRGSRRADAEALKAAASAGGAGEFRGVACKLIRNEFYMALLNEALSRGSEEEATVQTMLAFTADLSKGTEGLETCLDNVLNKFPEIRAKLRRGATVDFEIVITKAMKVCADKCMAMMDGAESVANVQVFESAMTKYKQCFGPTEDMNKLEVKLAKYHSESSKTTRATAVLKACASFMQCADIKKMVVYEELADASKEANGVPPEAFATELDSTLIPTSTKLIQALPALFGEAVLQVALRAGHALQNLLPKEHKELLSFRLEYLGGLSECKKAVDGYLALGGGVEARSAADPNEEKITEVMSMLAVLDDLKPGDDTSKKEVVGNMQAELDKMTKVVADVGQYSVGNAKAKAMEVLGVLKNISKGGKDGAAWDDGHVYENEADMMVDAEEVLGKCDGNELAILMSKLSELQKKRLASTPCLTKMRSTK